MISSVPYVPPDTMKKVAATRGQSVSFATFFLVIGIAREGNCAETDTELNLYSLVLLSETRSRRGGERPRSQVKNSELADAEYKTPHRMQEKNA